MPTLAQTNTLEIQLHRGMRQQNRGAAAVEFAVVLPLFLFLIAAVVDFSFYLLTSQQVRGAARAGAEYGFSYGYDECGIQIAAATSVKNGKLLKLPVDSTKCSYTTTGGLFNATTTQSAWCGCSGSSALVGAYTTGYVCPLKRTDNSLCPGTGIAPELYFSVTVTANFTPFFNIFQKARTITKTVYGRRLTS